MSASPPNAARPAASPSATGVRRVYEPGEQRAEDEGRLLEDIVDGVGVPQPLAQPAGEPGQVQAVNGGASPPTRAARTM